MRRGRSSRRRERRGHHGALAEGPSELLHPPGAAPRRLSLHPPRAAGDVGLHASPAAAVAGGPVFPSSLEVLLLAAQHCHDLEWVQLTIVDLLDLSLPAWQRAQHSYPHLFLPPPSPPCSSAAMDGVHTVFPVLLMPPSASPVCIRSQSRPGCRAAAASTTTPAGRTCGAPSSPTPRSCASSTWPWSCPTVRCCAFVTCPASHSSASTLHQTGKWPA